MPRKNRAGKEIDMNDLRSRLRRRLAALRLARADLEQRLKALDLVHQMVRESG